MKKERRGEQFPNPQLIINMKEKILKPEKQIKKEKVKYIKQQQQVREGIYLLDNGLSPYDSDIFHSSPYFLRIFQILLGKRMDDTSNSLLPIVLCFILSDLITSFNIYGIAAHCQSYLRSLGQLPYPKAASIDTVHTQDTTEQAPIPSTVKDTPSIF
ncbi:hypothetical protein RFI_15945, partial [Reticulomyxa filosa]